jgi:hypothetical protein
LFEGFRGSEFERIDTMVRNLGPEFEGSFRGFHREVLQAMVSCGFLYAQVYDLGRIHDDFIKARKVTVNYARFSEDPNC